MGQADYIIIGIIAVIVGGAACFVYRAKKKGAACIGCPYSGECSKCNCKK